MKKRHERIFENKWLKNLKFYWIGYWQSSQFQENETKKSKIWKRYFIWQHERQPVGLTAISEESPKEKTMKRWSNTRKFLWTKNVNIWDRKSPPNTKELMGGGGRDTSWWDFRIPKENKRNKENYSAPDS